MRLFMRLFFQLLLFGSQRILLNLKCLAIRPLMLLMGFVSWNLNCWVRGQSKWSFYSLLCIWYRQIIFYLEVHHAIALEHWLICFVQARAQKLKDWIRVCLCCKYKTNICQVFQVFDWLLLESACNLTQYRSPMDLSQWVIYS